MNHLVNTDPCQHTHPMRCLGQLQATNPTYCLIWSSSPYGIEQRNWQCFLLLVLQKPSHPWCYLPHLPVAFQGLGLPNMSLEMLNDSLRFFQKHRGQDTDYGKALHCIYELAQIYIGLDRNFFLHDCSTCDLLASYTWLLVHMEHLSWYLT
jgi:hypothetical protein